MSLLCYVILVPAGYSIVYCVFTHGRLFRVFQTFLNYLKTKHLIVYVHVTPLIDVYIYSSEVNSMC